jgi:hypothetical protein
MTDLQALTTADIVRTGAGLVGIGTIFYAWGIEPYRIQVTERTIGIPGLPDPLDGFTICHLSDLHVGSFRRVEKALARKLSGREVDLCLITGDLVSRPEGMKHVGRILSHLESGHGFYAVFGNSEHEPWTPGVPIAEELEAQGIRVLINQGERLTINGSEILIGGVDDPYLARAEPDRALAGPASLRILLAHSPDIVMDLGNEIPDLILSGHTHGGQICLPLVGALWLHCRHPKLGIRDGYYGPEELSRIAGRDLGGTQMYVGRGLGGSGIRARFLCRPEVVFLTLRKKEVETGSSAGSRDMQNDP